MKRVAFLTISIVVFSVSAIYTARLGWPNAGHDVNTGSEIVITLDTSQVSERVWYGTASGDVTGNLTLQTLDVPPQLFRGTWSGTTRWQVGAGTSSFTAEMRGKINTYNGALTMFGKVIDGANAGARVSAQGQVTSVNPHHFVGTIRVEP